MDCFKKKLSNFWYYYKWHTLLSIFVCFVLIVGVTQCSTKVKSDYLIMLGFNRYVPEEVIYSMCNYIENYGQDVNDDGQVVVEIIDVSTYSNQIPELYRAASSKMQAESLRNEVMLYIVDETFYDKMNNKIVVFDEYEQFNQKDNTAYNLNDTKFAKYVNDSYGKKYITTNTYITKRVINENDAKAKLNMHNAEQLLNNLIQHLNK